MMTNSGYLSSEAIERTIKAIDFRVEEIQFFSPLLYVIILSPSDPDIEIPECHPGQFVQVKIPNDHGILLRRPISIYNVDQRKLSLLIQTVGRGTLALSNARIGDIINLILPLGNGFTEPSELLSAHHSEPIKPLLIGGGVGIAPLYMLGKHLSVHGIHPTFLFGARSANLFPDLSPFEQYGTLCISTEDASIGERGFVTEHSIITNSECYNCIYTCGPTPMMQAVSKIAKEKHIPCQVSLENQMACGIGVCLCCIEPTINGYKSICTDGPVFDVNELKW